MVFRVDAQRLGELGAKAAEYVGELEFVVERRERKGSTVYLYFK